MIDRTLNYGRHILDQFTKNLAPSSPEVIIDIGAGSGADLKICQTNIPTAKLYALEAYAPNIKELSDHGFHVIPSNLEKDTFPLADTSVDLVIANQILEHCKEMFWIFHEVSRTLKVGGHFYIGVPNLAAFHSRLLLLFGRQPTCIRTASAHIRGLTQKDLVNFTETCAPGLYSLKMFRGSNFYPFPPVVAKPMARLLPNSAACIFLAFQKTRPYDSEFIKFPVGLETNYWLGQNQAEPL